MRRFLSGAAVTAVLAGAAVTSGIAFASPDTDGVQPMVSSSLVINEVATRGPNGERDEFIEIRNVSGQSINLENFVVRLYGAQNQEVGSITFPAGTELAPKGNTGDLAVLVGPEFSGTVPAEILTVPFNLVGTAGIPDTGGVALYTLNNVKVDGVAFSSVVTQAREGTAARPMTNLPVIDPLTYIASARDVLSTDTDNNRADFTLHMATPGELN
ncbi:lamin tail domain-containing protein [Saccharothrix syringae]|uniref:Lamin tail domain-containing protein n=1 Tax=Saccharothrix syringae TaxID=103733 RepID=A0A5Q0H2A5_SACSY|nr:lamin tail domain-containing protein [Saccharothrix syringae]QFZ20243.1 lamin tail domain-containing protein [Saccharothrix syringae]